MSFPYGSDYVFKVGFRFVLSNGELLLQFGDTILPYSSLPFGIQQAIEATLVKPISAAVGLAMNPLAVPVILFILSSIHQNNKRKKAESDAHAAQEEAKKAQQKEQEAQQRAQEAQQREQEAQEQLERGVEHVVPIPADEIRELRTALGLGEEGDVVDNIAVVGRVSSGKTSFINSCRGLRRPREESQDADPRYRLGEVGNEETTQKRTEYRHKDYPTIVWWDMPGTGGKNQREWTYYNTFNLGLYNFLLILHDKPFSQTECNIVRLHQERASQLPNPPQIFIIRTKSDESLRNIRRDNPELKGQELVARFKRENTESVKGFLSKAGLDDSVAIYHISADALYKAATGNLTKRKITFIDELKLLSDLRVATKWSDARYRYDGSPPTSASEDETDSGFEETGNSGPSGESARTGDDGFEEAISGVAEVKLTSP